MAFNDVPFPNPDEIATIVAAEHRFEDWESPPIFKPLAPTRGIGGAPLPKGNSFLNHAYIAR